MRNEEDLSEVLDRVAAFLGFKTDGSPSGTAKAFAHWLAFAEAFVASPDGQHQATWTEVFLRVVGMRGMMAARSEASEAAEVADAALKELVKRFPPRMQHVEPDENSIEMTWQDAAIFRGEELARWRDATGCRTPEDAANRIRAFEERFAQRERDIADVGFDAQKSIANLRLQMTKLEEVKAQREDELVRWRKVTGCETPEEASGIIASRDETLERRQREAAEVKVALAEMQKDRDLWRSNFYDAETLIHNIREALGLPKEGHADVLAVAAHTKASLDELAKQAREASEDCRKAEDTVDRIREAFGMASVDRICEIAKTALIPKPKPEKIEVGQRWARVDQIGYMWENGDVSIGRIGTFTQRVFECSTMVYLGKA